MANPSACPPPIQLYEACEGIARALVRDRTDFEGAIVQVENLSDVLARVSKLLIQAERSPNPADRLAAMEALLSINTDLNRQLAEAEAAPPDSMRRVEIAALRAATATLRSEIADVHSATGNGGSAHS